MTVEELLEKYTAGVRDFTAIDLTEANLSGVKLSGANFSQANLSVVNLSGANLSGANFSQAKLNVARLSGANLASTNFNNASLNVANLIRADLNGAQLIKASLIRAELIRADLSRANLLEANLSGADLREATLRQANLRRANLSEASLRGCLLTKANLEQANLNVTDLRKTDLSGANLRDAELRQVNLTRANLTGGNLRGANLRWADLSGANLRWADLSGAKLSGATLTGADLSNANLTNASLVHADLTQSRLIKVEWGGADLTGAILTGAKLYATSRFGLKTEGITCDWVDLSPNGDRSIIQHFNTEESQAFFNETPPTITIIIDEVLEHDANFALAAAYYHISQQYPALRQPPNIEIGFRRTILTFRVNSDEELFPTAFMVILPFKDAATTQRNIFTAVRMINSQNINKFGFKSPERVKQFSQLLEAAIAKADAIKQIKNFPTMAAKINFLQAPTQIILSNSSAQTLIIHEHPSFGKRFINPANANVSDYEDSSAGTATIILPSLSTIVDFVRSCHYIEN